MSDDADVGVPLPQREPGGAGEPVEGRRDVALPGRALLHREERRAGLGGDGADLERQPGPLGADRGSEHRAGPGAPPVLPGRGGVDPLRRRPAVGGGAHGVEEPGPRHHREVRGLRERRGEEPGDAVQLGIPGGVLDVGDGHADPLHPVGAALEEPGGRGRPRRAGSAASPAARQRERRGIAPAAALERLQHLLAVPVARLGVGLRGRAPPPSRCGRDVRAGPSISSSITPRE